MTTPPVLTVIGSSCSIPRPGSACSSYLIEDDDTAVVFDLGSGAFANLRLHREPDLLTAIVITHMHTDHFLDLIPMRYALRYGRRERNERIPLYLPPGGIAMLEALGVVLSRESGSFFHDVYTMREYTTEQPLPIGNAKLHFAATTHYIESYAVRYEGRAASIGYSSDTAYDPRVVAHVSGVDLFICEATLGGAGVEESTVRGHASAVDAARMAQQAGVEALLLTHYGSDVVEAELIAYAQEHFAGRFYLASDNLRIEIECRSRAVAPSR